MQIDLDCPHDYTMELIRGAGDDRTPLHVEAVGGDLGELVEETWTAGVLADCLPMACETLRATIRPTYHREPIVRSVEVELTVGDARFSRKFKAGRWSRRAVSLAHQMRDDGRLGPDETAVSVVCCREADGADPRVPPLGVPDIVEQELDVAGVRAVRNGTLDPLRPVLLAERMIEDVLRATEDAGASETGGAVLGKYVRLPEPLPGTKTRVVTLLTTALTDDRHVGVPSSFAFSPEALVEADSIAGARGRGEQVLTAFHTHGWGTACGNCNQSEGCALPQCTEVSLDDYQVLESMLPGKATLMPIAGRKLGAPGRRPVLELHAWSGGRMRPLPWCAYQD